MLIVFKVVDIDSSTQIAAFIVVMKIFSSSVYQSGQESESHREPMTTCSSQKKNPCFREARAEQYILLWKPHNWFRIECFNSILHFSENEIRISLPVKFKEGIDYEDRKWGPKAFSLSYINTIRQTVHFHLWLGSCQNRIFNKKNTSVLFIPSTRKSSSMLHVFANA